MVESKSRTLRLEFRFRRALPCDPDMQVRQTRGRVEEGVEPFLLVQPAKEQRDGHALGCRQARPRHRLRTLKVRIGMDYRGAVFTDTLLADMPQKVDRQSDMPVTGPEPGKLVIAAIPGNRAGPVRRSRELPGPAHPVFDHVRPEAADRLAKELARRKRPGRIEARGVDADSGARKLRRAKHIARARHDMLVVPGLGQR